MKNAIEPRNSSPRFSDAYQLPFEGNHSDSQNKIPSLKTYLWTMDLIMALLLNEMSNSVKERLVSGTITRLLTHPNHIETKISRCDKLNCVKLTKPNLRNLILQHCHIPVKWAERTRLLCQAFMPRLFFEYAWCQMQKQIELILWG